MCAMCAHTAAQTNIKHRKPHTIVSLHLCLGLYACVELASASQPWLAGQKPVQPVHTSSLSLLYECPCVHTHAVCGVCVGVHIVSLATLDHIVVGVWSFNGIPYKWLLINSSTLLHVCTCSNTCTVVSTCRIDIVLACT